MPHDIVLTRIRAEYLEMPGLRLTLTQAQRLFGIERAECQRVLALLVDVDFLCLKSGGAYTRITDGLEFRRPHPAKADVGTDQGAKNES